MSDEWLESGSHSLLRGARIAHSFTPWRSCKDSHMNLRQSTRNCIEAADRFLTRSFRYERRRAGDPRAAADHSQNHRDQQLMALRDRHPLLGGRLTGPCPRPVYRASPGALPVEVAASGSSPRPISATSPGSPPVNPKPGEDHGPPAARLGDAGADLCEYSSSTQLGHRSSGERSGGVGLDGGP